MTAVPRAAARISRQAQRHIRIRDQALAQNPRLRGLAGTNPWTACIVPLLLVLHWGTAALVAQSGSITVGFAVALFVGQLLMHSAGTLVHETAHRLIFRGRLSKLALDLGLEIVLASYGRQLTYQYEHVTSHHAHLGDYAGDYEFEDACHARARRSMRLNNPALNRILTVITLLLHALPLGFLVSDIVVPRLLRLWSGKGIRDSRRHVKARQVPPALRLLFALVSVLSNATLAYLFGWLALLYHVWALSLFLGKLGVTNLGQSLSEHEGDNEQHPTYSYYGPLNTILLNTGYHNEHHTFPNVPWNHLPRLKAAAPNIFSRENPKGYVALWWEHVRGDFSETRANPLVLALTEKSCPPDRPPQAKP